jgi:hypothetical protein
MPEGASGGEVREALEELLGYLSDLQPPLLVAPAVSLLLGQPAELAAAAIRSWAAGQLRSSQGAASPVDFYFHALKKLQLQGDLRLVPREPLASYVEALIAALVAAAPDAERDRLGAYLRRVTEVEGTFSPAVDYLHRPLEAAGGVGTAAGSGSAAAAAGLDEEMVRNLRHFTLLLDQLTAAHGAAGQPEEKKDLAALLVPQLVAAAAQGSRNTQEFELYLASLGRAGVMQEVRMTELFRTLSRDLPEWSLRHGQEVATYQGAPIAAMHRIVALEEDPSRNAARFRDLLKAAAEQFNSGSTARAVTILDLAYRIIAEQRVEKQTADLILGSAHEDLDAERLAESTQETASLPLLRTLLNFYPALTPHGLLLELDDEPDRGRRRLFLALVEAHGAAGRAAVLERLEQSFTGPERAVWFVERNFVYLLHRIPAPADADLTREVALTSRCSELQGEAALVRDAVTNLGMRRHPDAETTLRLRLEELERMLEGTLPTRHEPPELWRMLNMVISGLARFGTASARRVVIEHGLRQRPQLGDTLARLAELGGTDLSGEPETVERLASALRKLLPVRLLGFNLRRGGEAEHLVRALASTRAPEVRALLQEIEGRFPGEAIGKLAADALAAQDRPAPAAPAPAAPAAVAPAAPAASATPSIAGDMELFGLPELVQTLGSTEASGRLVIKDRGGAAVGELLLRQGKLAAARVGKLAGNDAFYQLLESPAPGTFAFFRQSAETVAAAAAQDFLPLLMEGMRRYDELQRARALAPDHGYLVATGARPTPRAEEADGGFIRDVWTRVKAGATPRDCEDRVAADAYRIRTLLAHWLEEGAIAVRQAPEVAPP